MAKYQYKVIDKEGNPTSGVVTADSQDAVAEKLKSSGFMPVSIKEIKEESGVIKIIDRFRKISPAEINMFTRQFAVLQRAGVNIIASINSLSEQSMNKSFKDILSQVASDIKQGKSLSSALERHPAFFKPLYTNMVKAGEESGSLVEVLERLADLGEYEEKVHLRVKAATRYPVIVVCTVIIAFLLLTMLVVPRFARIYGSAGVNLPIPTLILIWTNQLLTKYWWLAIFITAAVIFGINKYINTAKGRHLWDKMKLKIPVLGPLMMKITMGRFARVTGTLMRAGVPVLRILELASAGVGNVIISEAIDNIKAGIKEGKGISVSMKSTGLFSSIVVQMVSVGESTGKVDELLLHVSDYYDSQVAFTVDNLTSLIEPMLLLVLGFGVLLMALGIFLPMWNLMALFVK